MIVQEVMTANVSCVQQTDSIQKAAQTMKSVNCGSLPVCENNKVVGIITDRDIVLKSIAEGQYNASVRDCMTNRVITCTPEMDVHQAAELMSEHQIRRLPVVDSSGNICGMCAIGDLATIHIHVNEAGDALSKISEPSAGQNAVH
ncbi:CBS domain-containing protein [Alicyclobacillus tolerans]|uniref:CBS domain-containing protein n=1 Tax=Alicyclobacillus tolerans TaxID=90970 RepID=UPI001F273B87|nr:CBS domain-containing protein [Alicyclobacillus tolerans]MCF8566627.1 CBS domain-containing protein [Alicyclobacillus tolerans]